MRIIDYHYIIGTEERDGYIAIPELDRTQSSVRQFIKLANLDITLTRPTAFLYVDGFSISQADSGLSAGNPELYMPAIKSGSSYIAHEWVYTFKNKEHLVKVDITSGTCASGIQALHEADRLLKSGTVQEVIIIGGERITQDTLRLFKELHIPVTCGDGFVFMRVDLAFNNIEIVHAQWKYHFSNNPFLFTLKAINTLNPGYPVDFVKLHGTGTESNEAAEAGLAKLGIPLRYKPKIGHTQGISALLETCMVLDDQNIQGNILVTANGLGGFYGAFTLVKR